MKYFWYSDAGDKQSFTFGSPLTIRLLLPNSVLNAWLLQYQVGQHRLSNIFKQEHHNCGANHQFSHCRHNRTVLCSASRLDLSTTFKYFEPYSPSATEQAVLAWHFFSIF